MPLRIATADMIRDGHLPLWNPYIFCGMPLFASAQGGTLFPLNWAFLLGAPIFAMNLAVLGSYAAAGVGAFLYARRAGAALVGAIVTALVWQWCGFDVGQITHTNILHVFAVLPWIFWSIDGYVMRPSARRAALISLLRCARRFSPGISRRLPTRSCSPAATWSCRRARMAKRAGARGCSRLVFLAAGLARSARFRSCRRSNCCRPACATRRLTTSSRPTRCRASSCSRGSRPMCSAVATARSFRALRRRPFYPEYIAYVGIAPLILAASAPSSNAIGDAFLGVHRRSSALRSRSAGSCRSISTASPTTFRF